MDTETLTQLEEIFKPIADTIGKDASFGWETIKKQQYVYILFSGIGMVAGAFAIEFINSFIQQYTQFYPLGIIGYLAVAYLIGYCVYVFITRFLNPDYYVLQFFINLVKR